MSDPIISVENLSKKYRLGQIGTGTLSNDMKVWWALKRGMPNPMLKIGQEDHGNRKDGEIWALRGVNFTVQPGEVLGIIGRNGAGKSTLLKILSRVTAPTEGRVKVRGRIASLLEVGTGFHPELTGRENIYLNGAILGMTKQEIDRKFDEIVDFAEIEQFIETPVKRYSSGMYVRLAFSVAAHLESEILLVDEVLAVGDLEFQKKCIGKMGDIASEEGRTVLFVSHNMVSVRRLCERGILLNAGVIETMGPIDDTLNQYMSIKEKTQLQDLASRTDRSGNGKLRFTSIDVLDESKIKYNVKVGSPTSILIKYKGTAPLRNVRISLNIVNQYGERLNWLCNDFSGQPFLELPEKGTIRVDFPRFPYMPGSYAIGLQALVGRDIADKVPSATVFQVHAGDFYNSGMNPPAKSGAVLVPHTWSVQPEE